MTIALSPLAGSGWQFLDNSGNVLTYGKLYIYAAGTTTPITTYGNSSGSINNSNPIILDSAGRVPNQIWLTVGTAYKFVLQTSANVQIGAWDNVSVYPGAGGGSSVTWPVTLDDGQFLRTNNSIIIPRSNTAGQSLSEIPSLTTDPFILTVNGCGVAYPISFSESIAVSQISLGVGYNDVYLATLPDAILRLRFYTSTLYGPNEVPSTLVGGPYDFSAPSSNYGNPFLYNRATTTGLTFSKNQLYWVVFTTPTAGVKALASTYDSLIEERYVYSPINNTGVVSTESFVGANPGWHSSQLIEASIAGQLTLALTPSYNTLRNQENASAWGYSWGFKAMPFMRFFVSQP